MWKTFGFILALSTAAALAYAEPGAWSGCSSECGEGSQIRVDVEQCGVPCPGQESSASSEEDYSEGPVVVDEYRTDTSEEQVPPPWPSSNPYIRLVQGDGEQRRGRLEVSRNSNVSTNWGTVCDDGWYGQQGRINAQVACRHLGFPWGNASVVDGYKSTDDYQPIYLDEVNCTGDEATIMDCNNDPDTSDCSHVEDIAIECA